MLLGRSLRRRSSLLITSCDRDGDNCVDGQEWCDRFGAALRRLSGEGLITDAPGCEAFDLDVTESRLVPQCLEEGRWPEASEWGVSDHGIVTSRFVLDGGDRSSS